MKATLHPDAQQEVRDAFEHYEREQDGLGGSFVLAVDEAIGVIGEHPNRWPEHLAGTRRYRLHRFPYGLVYHVIGEQIEVLAVMDLRRRPGYWLRRLPK